MIRAVRRLHATNEVRRVRRGSSTRGVRAAAVRHQGRVVAMTRLRWFAYGMVGVLCQLGVTAERKDWPLAGGDTTNQRYSPLNQINRENVEKLGGAWVSAAFPDGATSRATPVIHDGLIFLNAGQRVHALDARNGQSVWS